MAFGEFYLRDTAGSPERARWLHLARSGSQSQCAICFTLPAHGASHIISNCIVLLPSFYVAIFSLIKLIVVYLMIMISIPDRKTTLRN